jgi:REP element-mobilizing transposase RayT
MERYRIRPEFGVYYLTYTVVDWLPVFIGEKTCRIVTESLSFCHSEKQLRINAFVRMPTHIHLITFDADFDSNRLVRTLADFRKFTGRQLSDCCGKTLPSSFADDLRARATEDRERRFWQPSRHPEALENERFWQQKLDYLHDNPCRKGLVRSPQHWRFSSASWYHSDGKEATDVPLTAIAW